MQLLHKRNAQIAQLVEQRTENPRVTGSIPVLGTTAKRKPRSDGRGFRMPFFIIYYLPARADILLPSIHWDSFLCNAKKASAESWRYIRLPQQHPAI